jgi:thiosulfate dehydrogenase
MRNFVIGFIVALAVVAVAAYIYFGMGFAPVATKASPIPFETTLAHMALRAKISKEGNLQAPIPADEANLTAGAQVYREHCSVCHGLMGQPETSIAKGMFPSPPQLLRGKGVTDDPPGETYWKAANGIRLTGMPGFKGSLSDTQLWQVSLMLANADKVPAAVKSLLSEPAPIH